MKKNMLVSAILLLAPLVMLRAADFYVAGSWLHLQGLEVAGVQVTVGAS